MKQPVAPPPCDPRSFITGTVKFCGRHGSPFVDASSTSSAVGAQTIGLAERALFLPNQIWGSLGSKPPPHAADARNPARCGRPLASSVLDKPDLKSPSASKPAAVGPLIPYSA